MPQCGAINKKSSSKIFWVVFLPLALFVGYLAIDKSPSTKSSSSDDVKSISSYPNKLKKFMDENIEAGLVHSYEFSNYERVIYVDPEVWSLFDAGSKKQFLFIIKSDLEELIGYHRFKVKDYRSDEVLAEVTSFGGSVKIYK